MVNAYGSVFTSPVGADFGERDKKQIKGLKGKKRELASLVKLRATKVAIARWA